MSGKQTEVTVDQDAVHGIDIDASEGRAGWSVDDKPYVGHFRFGTIFLFMGQGAVHLRRYSRLGGLDPEDSVGPNPFDSDVDRQGVYLAYSS